MIIVTCHDGTTFTVTSADQPPFVTKGPISTKQGISLVPVGTPPWTVQLAWSDTWSQTMAASPDVIVTVGYYGDDTIVNTIVGVLP